MSSYSTTIDEVFGKEREYMLQRFTGLPRVFPIGVIFEDKKLWGFKLYNLDTQEMTVNSIGNILDLRLSGTVIAGISVKEKYDSSPEDEVSWLTNIALEFDIEFYNYMRMSIVDKSGELRFDLSEGTIIGVNEDNKQFVVVRPDGTVYNITKEDMCKFNSNFIGMNISNERVAIQSLQPYKERNNDKE